MNKLVKAIVGILAASIIAGIAGAWFISPNPTLLTMEPVLSADELGNIYFVENRASTSNIYAVDEKGSICFSYSENNKIKKERTVIAYSAVDDNMLYFIREWPNQKTQSPKKWELVRYDKKTKDSEIIQCGPGAEISKITGISFDNESIYLSGMNESNNRYEKALMYEMDRKNSSEGFQKVLESLPLPGDEFKRVMYADDILSCLLKSGTILKTSNFQRVYIPSDNNEIITAIGADGNYFWYYDRKNNTVRCSSAMVVGTPIALEKDTFVKCGTAIGSNGMAMLLDSGNNIELLQIRGEISERISKLEISPIMQMKIKKDSFILCFEILVVLFSLIAASMYLYFYSRRLAVKVSIIFGYGAVLLLFAVGTILITDVTKAYNSQRLSETQVWSDARSKILLQRAEDTLSEGNILDTTYNGLGASLQPAVVDTNENLYVVSGDLLSIAKAPSVLISSEYAQGLPARICYTPTINEMIELSMATNTIVEEMMFERGMPIAVNISPVNRYGEPFGTMVTKTTADDILKLRNELAVKCLTIASLFAILIIAAAGLLAHYITRHIPKLGLAMDDISDGKFYMEDSKTGNDEIGDLWWRLKEVCMSLAIKDYEMKSTIASFHRFVPKGMEHLLNRSSIMEVSFGDLANINSSIAILSVNNIETVRKKLDDRSFMSFVNKCYGYIQNNLNKFNGMLLSNQFDFSELKITFSGNKEYGVDFALKLLGDAMFNKQEEELRPDIFMLLHTSEFLYGVAGTSDTAFPFISSQEMTFLSKFPKKFADLGVKIVVTEQYLAGMSKQKTMRYIGFIASENDEFVYKIYELLDVYNDIEKQQRASYDKRFQNAISLYYKNNFYLARNEFSMLLKICPEDGIVRWYLFACEYYFNNEDTEDAVYRLFGIRDSL